jgi:tRNA(Ile)-lysidine synthase
MWRQRVRKFIEAQGLLQPGDTVVVGVSGGPDSLCLLDVLHALSSAFPLTLHVAHLNHGLRPEAGEDADFTRAEAQGRGLAFHEATADTRAYAATHKRSIEEAARQLRYDFLGRVARAVGAEAVAVAHTADDQAETVLMHFLRGSGLAGLRGMSAKSQLPTSQAQNQAVLVRPLLTVTRAEVEAYCRERGLHPRQDATNLDPAFFRNRLRHELLPLLETYNPNLRATLQRTADVLAGEHAWLQSALAVLWQRIALTEPGAVVFDRAQWQALSLAEQRALLRYAVWQLQPGRRDVDFAPLAAAVQFSRTAAPGRSCDVLGRLRLTISDQQLTLNAWETALRLPEDVPLLTEDGQLASGWMLRVEPLSAGQWSANAMAENSNPWRVHVDANRLPAPLRLRARRPGDRLQPLGLEGHTLKLSDLMINLKLPAAARDRWPLVVSGDEIVWVAGLRLDERFKVRLETVTVLRLEFESGAKP